MFRCAPGFFRDLASFRDCAEPVLCSEDGDRAVGAGIGEVLENPSDLCGVWGFLVSLVFWCVRCFFFFHDISSEAGATKIIEKHRMCLCQELKIELTSRTLHEAFAACFVSDSSLKCHSRQSQIENF